MWNCRWVTFAYTVLRYRSIFSVWFVVNFLNWILAFFYKYHFVDIDFNKQKARHTLVAINLSKHPGLYVLCPLIQSSCSLYVSHSLIANNCWNSAVLYEWILRGLLNNGNLLILDVKCLHVHLRRQTLSEDFSSI